LTPLEALETFARLLALEMKSRGWTIDPDVEPPVMEFRRGGSHIRMDLFRQEIAYTHPDDLAAVAEVKADEAEQLTGIRYGTA
jgi:hypothetical protein